MKAEEIFISVGEKKNEKVSAIQKSNGVKKLVVRKVFIILFID